MENIFKKIWKSYSIGVVVVVVGIILSLLSPRFLSIGNLLNVMTNASLVAILGLGMTLAIASGNFDLSVGSTAAFAGASLSAWCQSLVFQPVSLPDWSRGHWWA